MAGHADFIVPSPTEPARAPFEDCSPEGIRRAQHALAHGANAGQLTLDWDPLPFTEPPIWHVPAPIRWKPIVDLKPL